MPLILDKNPERYQDIGNDTVSLASHLNSKCNETDFFRNLKTFFKLEMLGFL